MSLLAAPMYFKLRETKKGTVLVKEGVFRKTEKSQRYGNDQFYFMDRADKKLKCLSGGSLGAIIRNNDLDVNSASKPVEIIYMGEEEMTTGDFKGQKAHQFEVNPVKKCCGGPYMYSSNPQLKAFCDKVTPEQKKQTCCGYGFHGHPVHFDHIVKSDKM